MGEGRQSEREGRFGVMEGSGSRGRGGFFFPSTKAVRGNNEPGENGVCPERH